VSTQPVVTRKRVPRKLLLIIVVVAIVVVAFGIPALGRAIYAPWSIGWFGRATLTGHWVGTMQARQGAEYGLSLRLDYKENSSTRRSRSRGTGRTNLEGRATLCTPTGERFEYDVSGRASPFGKINDLWLEYADPSLSRLNFQMTGKWDAPDLRLETDKNPFQPDGRFVVSAPVSSADPDDSFAPFTLAEDDQSSFEAICQRVQE
jgi:hypothetical protein